MVQANKKNVTLGSVGEQSKGYESSKHFVAFTKSYRFEQYIKFRVTFQKCDASKELVALANVYIRTIHNPRTSPESPGKHKDSKEKHRTSTTSAVRKGRRSSSRHAASPFA